MREEGCSSCPGRLAALFRDVIPYFCAKRDDLGNTDSADSSTADKPGDTPIPNSDMETSQEERREAVVPTTATQQPSDNGESGTGKEGGREGEKGLEEREITFWQEVVDPNTNHAYYWNPLTNEVAWTLPENGVISEDGQQMSTETSSTSKETTYADYYAYYAQTYYGVSPSSSTAARGGHKRKVQDVGESPLVSSVQCMKKPRLQAGSPPSTPLSKQAEQALRVNSYVQVCLCG